MPQKPKPQTGYDVVIVTAFELIGVALLSLLAGINKSMGRIVITVMAGFLVAALIYHSDLLLQWFPPPKQKKKKA